MQDRPIRRKDLENKSNSPSFSDFPRRQSKSKIAKPVTLINL
jgi:hypothetical protein